MKNNSGITVGCAHVKIINVFEIGVPDIFRHITLAVHALERRKKWQKRKNACVSGVKNLWTKSSTNI